MIDERNKSKENQIIDRNTAENDRWRSRTIVRIDRQNQMIKNQK